MPRKRKVGTPVALSVEFRMNGVGNAFLRELGCRDCPQCGMTKPRASTSGSLLVFDGVGARARPLMHLLFDCGAGVTDSLIDRGVDAVSALFISHSHLDHSLELDR